MSGEAKLAGIVAGLIAGLVAGLAGIVAGLIFLLGELVGLGIAHLLWRLSFRPLS